jgi:hypothetical protein
VLRDIAVGDVRSAIDAHSRDVRISGRNRQAHVCHEDGGEGEPIRRPEADFLHWLWSGVGVDPQCHDHKVHRLSGKSFVAFPAGGKIVLDAIVVTP